MRRQQNPASIIQMKARSKMLQRQMDNQAVFLLQTCRFCFQVSLPKAETKKQETELESVRNRISKAQSDKNMYMQFYQQMLRLTPQLPDLIERNVQSQIDFLKLEACAVKTELGTYVQEPVYKLWIFLLKLFFEKPKLLLEKEDDKHGQLADLLRMSLPFFIAECVPLPSLDCPLTEEALASHDTKDTKHISLLV